MSEYNGWTNYATWNMNLWLDNTETLYRQKRAILETLYRPVSPFDVQMFCKSFMDNTTPDLQQGDYKDIDWQEIADNWEIERLEIRDDDPGQYYG